MAREVHTSERAPGGGVKSTFKEQQYRLAEFLDSTGGKLTILGGAIAATAITARHAIGVMFFNSMNKAKAFTDLQEVRDKAIGNLIDQAKHGEKVDLVGKVQEIHAQYEKELYARMDNLGFSNTLTKWRMLKHHQHMEVMMATGAVAAVALGAIFSLASSRDIAQRQEEMEQENQEMLAR